MHLLCEKGTLQHPALQISSLEGNGYGAGPVLPGPVQRHAYTRVCAGTPEHVQRSQRAAI